MQSSLKYLLKILRHESSRGFDDSAIIGGLVKMMDHWVPEARNENVLEETIQDVINCVNTYHELDREGRRNGLKELWGRIKSRYPADNEIAENDFLTRELPATSPKYASRTEAMAGVQPPKNMTPTVHKNQTPPRSNSQPGAVTSKTPVALNASLTVLNGVGPRNAQNLARLGLQTRYGARI